MSAAASRSCAVATLVVFALWLAGTARARGADWPAPLPAQASAQQATTWQGGTSNADATDAQPTNVFVSLRINSPGGNGPVTQTSTTAVAADTANDAATAQDAWQDWAPGDEAARPAPQASSSPQASAQESGTTQAAATTATATRPQPTNVVVSVRVNSPGDDGPVTQSSTVAVAAQSKNTAATAQQAQQAQGGGGGVATAAPPAKPAPGAVADRSADAPAAPSPTSCVRVAPGSEATRIVITLGKSCPHVALERAAVVPPKRKAAPSKPKPEVAAVAAPIPAAPVVHAAAVSPAPPASPPPRATPKPRPAPAAAPHPSIDPLAASTKVAQVVAAAAPVPSSGDAQYEVLLALLLAMLGVAALWSYGGAHRYRYWRWR